MQNSTKNTYTIMQKNTKDGKLMKLKKTNHITSIKREDSKGLSHWMNKVCCCYVVSRTVCKL